MVVVIARQRLAALLAATSLASGASSACNAITDTGKYEVVDCPSGACLDGSRDGTPGGTDGASATDAGAEAEPPPLPACDVGRAPLRLTVTGASGSVSSNPGGLSVAAGSTETACFAIDRVELRTDGASATWTGTSCKDGSRGDRCELDLSAAGLTVTAALP